MRYRQILDYDRHSCKVSYSQNFIFIVTCQQTQETIVFVLEAFPDYVMYHNSLLVPMVSYKENEVL